MDKVTRRAFGRRRAQLPRQTIGAWGADERLYRMGPWSAGSPSQGYQLPLTPADKIARECRSSPQLIERKRAREDKETFRGSSRRQRAQTMGGVAQ
jgi:hypothetical protein